MIVIVTDGIVAGCETLCFYLFLFLSAAVVAIITSPVATSSAAVAETALWAVRNLTNGNAENAAKLGSAGGCEGE